MKTDAIQPAAWRVSMGTTADQNYWHYFSKKPKAIDDGEIWEPLYSASTLESLQRENEELVLRANEAVEAANALQVRTDTAEAEVARLQAEIDRKSSMPGDHRYWEGRYRDEAAENEKLKAGIKRLSDEEELLAETTDGDMMSLVSLAAKLAEAEKLARTYEGEANQLRDVSISNRIRAEEAEAGEKRLREVLAFYANPDIYKPHPHGLAFDRRDLSYSARTALASTGGEHHAD